MPISNLTSGETQAILRLYASAWQTHGPHIVSQLMDLEGAIEVMLDSVPVEHNAQAARCSLATLAKFEKELTFDERAAFLRKHFSHWV